MNNLRILRRGEKGEISNMIYNYGRAITQKRRDFMREKLFEYIESLLNEEVST